jgi:hypothetical protein
MSNPFLTNVAQLVPIFFIIKKILRTVHTLSLTFLVQESGIIHFSLTKKWFRCVRFEGRRTDDSEGEEAMGRNLLNCSALELLINLNLLEASLLPHLSPADRAAQLDTGKDSQLLKLYFLLHRFLRKIRYGIVGATRAHVLTLRRLDQDCTYSVFALMDNV